MANIIQQFKNANGDNIYPVAYAQGGMKMDLLWTNPSPNSAFSAQTLSLDLSEYAFIIIDFFSHQNEQNRAAYSDVFMIDGEQRFSFSSNGYTPGYFGFGRRAIIVTNNGITFGSGLAQSSWANSTTNENVVIPYKVYGIKMSYIVPTSVHGLQYVEV